jgi:ligand-binding sensor domain-containing protein
MPLKSLAWTLAVTLSLANSSEADDVLTLTAAAIEMTSAGSGDGWYRWNSIGDIDGGVAYRERLTSLSACENAVWVGTSYGRLLSRQDNQWTLQGTLQGIQITGIAFEGSDKVWLSTSDGIRRLDRAEKQTWKVSVYRDYYEGHPSFVSGAYIPGEDAVRRWGYVDDIYFPQLETAYSPFAISTEHGLFCWGNYGGVWHHFMPHYFGANSAWVDTRNLLPHRRPTCMVEDKGSNLWIGTQWDGLVRLNANARRYHARNPDNNKQDGTEFSDFGATEVGCQFDRVDYLASSAKLGIWAVLSGSSDRAWLARFDGQRWESMALDGPVRSVVETEPDVVMIGVDGEKWGRHQGLREVTWPSKKVQRLSGPENVILEIVRLPNGRIFAASWWNLYERDLAGKAKSPKE